MRRADTDHALGAYCPNIKNHYFYNMALVLNKGASKKEIDAINEKLKRLPSRKKLDVKKYCGIIKLKEDPLLIQKKLRDEWDNIASYR